jgi:hypothetical protein
LAGFKKGLFLPFFLTSGKKIKIKSSTATKDAWTATGDHAPSPLDGSWVYKNTTKKTDCKW